MLEFLRGEADVLVCTTIVESGLDIPTANTLIVERADALGLAQLYQIRGRVGRSRERAYAYLFYPSHAALTEDAQQRLSTLSDYTELGSGFKIAMRDLEIRGAGNLLGEEQSGHVAAVGLRALRGDARRGRGRARRAQPRTRPPSRSGSTSPSTPTCPATTSPTRRPRSRSTAAWRARSEIATLIVLREELEDRFGPVPAPLENLIRLQDARIKLDARARGTVGFRGGRSWRCRRSSWTRAARRRSARRFRAPSTSPAAAP